ncbi:DUF169 domain-containing protein [Candidatus Bathyarchaeota archaeon]|nr:DUF169 domain-containing protein [Candidatus Bathyarchaeota archaeon]
MIEELKLYGDPIALSWFPEGSMPSYLEKYIYKGDLKLVHCQFMQRARFRKEVYILDGIYSRPDPPVCNGDAYIGLTDVEDRLIAGLTHSRTDPSSGSEARLGIFGSPTASIRSLNQSYWIVPPIIKYFGIAPLSECPFDPDVVTIIGNPRQLTMACRALMYFTGKGVEGETGPGTCSSSWVAAYLSGEPHYTLGCHGVFGTMGVDPTEICLSIPSEQVPTLCQVLELWKERGKKMFTEAPPNELREYIKAPYEGPFKKDDDLKPGYIPWEKRLETPYKSWKDRQKENR